jgi:DNA-binding MarR family transcriptional regulator
MDMSTNTAAIAWEPFLRLHARVEQAVTRQLRRTGVGVSNYRALQMLSQAPEREIRLLDLADMLSLTQSSTSRLVDRLVSDGHAHRDSCGDDKRGVYVVITDAGVDHVERTRPVYEDALNHALLAAGEDPEIAPLVRSIRTSMGSPPSSFSALATKRADTDPAL